MRPAIRRGRRRQPRGAAAAAPLDPVAKHCGDVVGVVESVLPDDARNQPLEVVVVGLGPTEGRCERPEGGRLDDRCVLLRRQTGAAEQVGEAVLLSLGCDRLEFGGKAVDSAVQLVLRLHRLERRQARAAVLEYPEEHRSSGDVVRLWRRVAVVGLVESDVRDVGLAAPAHRDVEVLPSRRRGDDDMRRVDRDALGAVRGDGVPEVEMLVDVSRGSTAVPCVAGRAGRPPRSRRGGCR